MAVLIVTNEQDLGADFVVVELERRGVSVLRCNAERFTDWRVSMRPGTCWELRDPRGRVARSDTTSGVWWRRPEAPALSADLSTGERQAIVEQWQAFAEGLASVPGPVWVSPPAAIASAEDKASQLATARRIGWAVPDTVWTNDIDEARTRAQSGATVVKSVTAAHWECDGEAGFVFAHALSPGDLPDTAEAFAAAPAALQARIEPKRDIRVSVAGPAVFAAETSSDKLDWRLMPTATWHRHDLPPAVAEQCRSLVEALGLRFGGIDLALDRNGDYWFLEINPNGEWGWLQTLGLPIAESLGDLLAPR